MSDRALLDGATAGEAEASGQEHSSAGQGTDTVGGFGHSAAGQRGGHRSAVPALTREPGRALRLLEAQPRRAHRPLRPCPAAPGDTTQPGGHDPARGHDPAQGHNLARGTQPSLGIEPSPAATCRAEPLGANLPPSF